MRVKLLLILLISLYASVGFSETQDATCHELDSFRDSAKEMVRTAINNKVEKVDGYRLDDILQKIDQPCLLKMSGITVKEGDREGGFYQAGEGDSNAKLNPKVLSSMPQDLQAPLVLHELLGASHFPDQSYDMTLQIIYANRNSLQNNGVVKSLIQERSDKNRFSTEGGSGTSVGGGGDSLAIEAKLETLDRINQLTAAGQTSYNGSDLARMARITLDCNFEFYPGIYVVKAEAVMKNYYYGRGPSAPDFKMVSVPTGTVYIRRDWLEKASSDDAVKLILDGLAIIAAPNVELCQIPFFPYHTF